MSPAGLLEADLIRDEPLAPRDGHPIAPEVDTLNHRSIAERVAELATLTDSHLNIALYGPWGSGKSSFYGLMKHELAKRGARAIDFDAWANSGPNFQTNFLSCVASQLPKVDADDVTRRLSQSRRTINLPFGLSQKDKNERRRWWDLVLLGVVIVFLVLPILWAALTLDAMGASWPAHAFSAISDWFSIAISGSILVAGIGLFAELTKVTVEESTPSYVFQFSQLFREILESQGSARYVVLVDDLDRCAPEDVIRTLEGLRTFLGHRACTFVVAFDRESIALTIKNYLHHNVPTRPDRPYYGTAGEYLDKIFQFQVSLPPQPPHAFRRYAFALVKEKDGLWAALPTDTLARVVTILSPIHVTSPRRTKVLLNDFAVNVRILEGLGFDWKARAEEIAALTVIQTEFPNLATQIEREPELLLALATLERPSRRSLSLLYDEFQLAGDSHRPLDEIVAPTSEPASEPEANDERDRAPDTDPSGTTASQLLRNLHRFLRMMAEMGCQIPRADLIMMHSSDDLLAFDSANTYNAVIRVADVPLDDAIDALREATDRDRLTALTYLLEHIEGELPDAIVRYVVVAGEIAAVASPSAIAPHAARLVNRWDALVADGIAVNGRFTPGSFLGLARAVGLAGSDRHVAVLCDLAEASGGEVLAAVLETLLDLTKIAERPQRVATLADRSIHLAATESGPLLQVLGRYDSESSILSGPRCQVLAELLSADPPREAPPAATTPAAAKAAAEEMALAIAVFEEESEQRRALLERLLAGAPKMNTNGVARTWLLDLVRLLLDVFDWADEIFESSIRNDVADGAAESANNYLLKAMRRGNAEQCAGWSRLLTSQASAEPANASAALDALYQQAASAGLEDGARPGLVSALESVTSLMVENSLKADVVVLEPRVRDAILSSTWSDAGLERLRFLRHLIATLGRLPDSDDLVDSLNVELFYLVGSEATDPPLLESAAQELTGLSIPALSSIVGRLSADCQTEVQADPTSQVTLLLVAQLLLLQRGEAQTPLDRSIIERAARPVAGAPLVQMWLATGPGFSAVRALAAVDDSVRRVPAQTWRTFSGRAGAEAATAAWHWACGEELGQAALTAIASGGVQTDLYDAIAAEIVSGAAHKERDAAHRHYMTLPPGTPGSVKSALQILDGLAVESKAVDLPNVADCLVANAPHFSARERTHIKRKLDPWVKRHDSAIPQRILSRLVADGMLSARKSWIPPRLR